MGLANDATRLRTASVRQDHRQYCVLVLRTHPVGAEKVFFTNVAILRRTGIDRLHVAGTNPSHQRWFLPVSAGTYPSGQRCCAASASHSGRTKGGGSPPPHSTAPALTMTTIPTSGVSDFWAALVTGWKVVPGAEVM